MLDEKKMGFEWGFFIGLILEKDYDIGWIIEVLKFIFEVFECYFIIGFYMLYFRILVKSNEYMWSIFYDKIDNIFGVVKMNLMIEFGCVFK